MFRFVFLSSNSLKAKNKGELIPPVMKHTVSYLKRKGMDLLWFQTKKIVINIWDGEGIPAVSRDGVDQTTEPRG